MLLFLDGADSTSRNDRRQLHRKVALPLALTPIFLSSLDETVCNGKSKTGPPYFGNRRIRLATLEQVLLLFRRFQCWSLT